MTKFTRSEIDAVITNFTTAAHTKYENHAYSSGYLSTLLAVAMERLPKATQEVILKQMMEQAHELYGSPTCQV
jgi:hypothetical protein